MNLAWKVLDGLAAANGGDGAWHRPHSKNRPGKWMPRIADPEPCVRGYHLCCNTTDLLSWLGPTLWVAEWDGAMVEDGNKIVVERARLVRRVDAWNDTSARLFAADCAEHVLHLFENKRPGDERPRKAIAAARAYARGEIGDSERAAAWAAARDAAWAATRDASGYAARDAAGAASGYASGYAAGAASGYAARAAARDAAKDAERQWQSDLLTELVGTPEQAAA